MTEVHLTEVRFDKPGPGELGPVEVGLREAREAEIRVAKVRPDEGSPAQIRLVEVGLAEACQAENSSA